MEFKSAFDMTVGNTQSVTESIDIDHETLEMYEDIADMTEFLADSEAFIFQSTQVVDSILTVAETAQKDRTLAVAQAELLGSGNAGAVLGLIGCHAMESEQDAQVAMEGAVETVKKWFKQLVDWIKGATKKVWDFLRTLFDKKKKMAVQLKSLQDSVVANAKDIDIAEYGKEKMKAYTKVATQNIQVSCSTAIPGAIEEIFKLIDSNKDFKAGQADKIGTELAAVSKKLDNKHLKALGMKVMADGDMVKLEDNQRYERKERTLKELGYSDDVAGTHKTAVELLKGLEKLESMQGKAKTLEGTVNTMAKLSSSLGEAEIKDAKTWAKHMSKSVNICNSLLTKCASMIMGCIQQNISALGKAKSHMKKA
jgi:methylthioribose-1-phosphate isomerase